MSIAEEIEQLQSLHAQGALTDDEFAHAKASLLVRLSDEPPVSGVDALSEQVEQLRLRNEIIQLDLDWNREREGYMVRGRYSERHLPTEARAIIQAIILIGVGIYITFLASSTGFTGAFLLIGLGFIIVGVLVGVSSFKKARAYKQAEQRYKERRRELASRQLSPKREH